jgi:hypothetical protein
LKSLILIFLLLPTLSSAQDRPKLLTTLYITYATAQALDIDSTHRAISVGKNEGNKFMAGCVAHGLSCTIPVKSIVTLGTIYLVDKTIRSKSSQAAIALMIGLNLSQWLITGNNYNVYFTYKKHLGRD